MIVELNEVKLVDELTKWCKKWLADVRFTQEMETDIGVTMDQLSTTPQVYKYYLPLNNTAINNDVDRAQFPCVIVRPNGSTVGFEDGENYEDFDIDLVVFVSEFDTVNRYQFALLAKKLLINGLLGIPRHVLAQAFLLNPTIKTTVFDDSQSPKGGLVISTTWRVYLPATKVGDIRDYKF